MIDLYGRIIVIKINEDDTKTCSIMDIKNDNGDYFDEPQVVFELTYEDNKLNSEILDTVNSMAPAWWIKLQQE